MISFKTPEEIFASPPVWYPGSMQFDNYARAVQGRRCDHGLEQPRRRRRQHGARDAARHDLPPTASRASGPAARTSRTGSSSQRMVPPIAIVFPIFLLYVWLGWVDTYHRPDPALHRVQPALRDLDDARLHRGHPARARGERAGRRLHALAGDPQGGVPDGARRPVRDRGLHLRVRLERLHLRAGADAHRGHHLPGPGHPLLRRPVEFLGQDRGDVACSARCRSSSPWRSCSATWCAASRWAR